MAGYSTDAFKDKLLRLNATQSSIQTLAQWILFHRRHCAASVQVWADEVKAAPPDRQLTYWYLCNDVLQNSKRKGDEFLAEFRKVLLPCLSLVFRYVSCASHSHLAGKHR